jgi:class 3 adenylate cyclase/tetratricopeptide (TPR) repeat protein
MFSWGASKMKCPKCHSENREGIKFCEECGSKMEIQCPSCNALIPMEKKFCGECGRNLATTSEPVVKELSFDEKLDKIQRYLPKGLTEKILSQKDKIEGERKQVTVMFCDLEGFTSLSERLGPEEAYDIVDQIYELLIHKVHDYEGTVNEMTGDGIVALFGAPIALEDAPQRAVRSAMAIHREMSRFSDRLKQEREYLPTLKMRVGIHTGPVVVGTVGNNLRVEFKAVGDTVNLASRMEGLAEPGATYVTEDTFKLTEGFFRFEALGDRKVKGKREPLKVYRVIAPSTSRTRFEVSAERGLTPFVGREKELELLLDGFERAKAGRGQAFSIVSEAGVGKSRLLYEFRNAVSSADLMFLEGRCLSYGRAVTYHPLIDIIRSNFDIRESDRGSEIRAKVIKGLKILRVEEFLTLPYFLELLSVKDSGIDKIAISPEAKKDRVIQAYKLITLKGSEIRPLVLAFEDLHWIDKSSEEVLKYVFESIPGARVLMIFTYRPEFVHTWGGKSYHSQVNLNRLSNRESLAMVSHLLGTEDIDSDLEELVLEKTEGVPFFIEEFIKSLKDLKIIERKENKYHLTKGTQEVTIPSTIQDVIMARVDSLPAEAKEVLQTGSVIEREFSYELIKRVTDLPELELLSHLSVLKDSELLYERGIYPQSTYIFRHALTQEVVYDSILTKKKKNIHEEIAKVIENLYKQNLDEHYEVLTEHYIRSEIYGKGAEYSRLARKKALKTGSVNDGIVHAKKTVACLERLPQSDDILERIVMARTILGFHYAQLNYHVEAKEVIEPIVDQVLMSDDKRRQSQVLTILGNHSYMVEEDFPKAINHLEEALKLAEEIKDIASLSQAEFWLGLGLSLNCQFEKGLGYLEKALEKSLAANSLWGASVAESNISYFVYFFQGKFNNALQHSLEAIRLAEESDDIYSKAIAYSVHAISCYGKGLLKEAKQDFLRGIDYAQRLSYFLWLGGNNLFLGEIYSELGDYKTATDYYEDAILFMERSKSFRSWTYWGKIALANAKMMNKEQDINFDSLYEYVSQNKIKIFDGLLRRYVGEILLHFGDKYLSDAEGWIKKAMEADERHGMRWHLGSDYALYGEFFKRKVDLANAKENLNKAIEIFRECGADGLVKKTEHELTTIS